MGSDRKRGEERERGVQELLLRIDYEKLKQETAQELGQKGLYAKNEYEHFLIPNYTIIEGIITRRKVGRHLKQLAEQLQGSEKELALDLSSDSFLRAIYLKDQYEQEAKQEDRAMERHNGEPTVRSSLNAWEILHRFGIIDNEEYENEKREALGLLETESGDTQP